MQKVHHHYHLLQMTSLITRLKFTVQSGDGDLFKLLQPRHLGPWHQLHRPLQDSCFSSSMARRMQGILTKVCWRWRTPMWTPTSCPTSLATRSSSCHSACSSVGRIIVRKAILRCNRDLQTGRSRCWRSTSFKKAIAVKLEAKLNNTSDLVKLHWDSVHASNVCEGGLTIPPTTTTTMKKGLEISLKK